MIIVTWSSAAVTIKTRKEKKSTGRGGRRRRKGEMLHCTTRRLGRPLISSPAKRSKRPAI
jgi:hypothetical protein